MTGTIDVWMQHPTAHFIRHDMFDSLRRWTRAQPTEAMEASGRGDSPPASPSPPWTLPEWSAG